MLSKKGRNKRKPRVDTLIGPQTKVLGNINFSCGLHIEGMVTGNITAEDNEQSQVQLGESGNVEGEINAPYVIINGSVSGDVHGSEHVELAPKARINGDVYYNLIEIAAGASVNGKLIHKKKFDTPLALSHAPKADGEDK